MAMLSLTKTPIIYVTREIERALGLPLDTPGYFIISNFTPFAKRVARGRKNVVLVKEEKMLDTYELLQWAAVNNVFDFANKRDSSTRPKASVGMTPAIVVFKPTTQIEKICADNNLKLLNPSAELSNKVEEKISQIEWLGPLKKYLPDYKVQLCKNIKWPGHKFVLQFNRSHTGSGTVLIENIKKLTEIKRKFPEREARIAKYIDGPLFTNNNVVAKDTVLLGNINYQITGLLPFTDNPFSTIGNDWELPHKLLNKKQITQYNKIATDVGNRLCESGWKGLFGIDVVLEQKTRKLYLLEINCRQPASTTYESQLQQKVISDQLSVITDHLSLITTFEAHILAILNQPLKNHHLIRLSSGAQIIQRVTKDIPTLKEPKLYKPDDRFSYILYNNTNPGSDLLRLQTKQGIMESHNKLNELGNQLMDFIFCANGESRWNAPRGAVIIIKDKKILLIRRHKCGRKYYVLPGGTMEKGETIKQTAIREAKEETGFDVTLSKQKHWKSKFEYRDEYYFFVDKTKGRCHLGGPEAKLNNPANHYGLEWVEMKKLSKINLVPSDIKEKIIKFSIPCSQGRARERSGQTYL